MANITGVKSGLRPQEIPPPKKVVPKEEPVNVDVCFACQAQWYRRPGKHTFTVQQDVDGNTLCPYCVTFFGAGLMPGVTSDSPEEANRKLAELRTASPAFIMVIRELSLAAPDGRSVNIGAGDIFPFDNPPPAPSLTDRLPRKERTWGAFTIQLTVGPYKVTLFTHEWAVISFTTVMELRRTKEIVDCYVATNDPNGHFTPSKKLKKEIDATFGHLTGARRLPPRKSKIEEIVGDLPEVPVISMFDAPIPKPKAPRKRKPKQEK